MSWNAEYIATTVGTPAGSGRMGEYRSRGGQGTPDRGLTGASR